MQKLVLCWLCSESVQMMSNCFEGLAFGQRAMTNILVRHTASHHIFGSVSTVALSKHQIKPVLSWQVTKQLILLQVVTDVDGSVMDSFTLHKPMGWRPKDTDSLVLWEKSVLGVAGRSGHAVHDAAKTAVHRLKTTTSHVGSHCDWVAGIVQYVRWHQSHMLSRLHRFLKPERVV